MILWFDRYRHAVYRFARGPGPQSSRPGIGEPIAPEVRGRGFHVMANPYVDIQGLAVRRTPTLATSSIRPPRRWISRLVLPGLILGGFTSLVLGALWDVIVPPVAVKVMPVTTRTGTEVAADTVLFKAPGYVEQGPIPIHVAVRAQGGGLLRELLVRPGDFIRPGRVVARLDSTFAAIDLSAAQAELANRQAERTEVEAAWARAWLRLDQATLTLKQKKKLHQDFPDVGATRVEYEQAGLQWDMAWADILEMDGKLATAEARVDKARVDVKRAEQQLEFMTIESEHKGVVMALKVGPGSMIGGVGQPDSVATLYDPEQMQIRVEVPINDFKHVQHQRHLPVRIEVNEIFPDQTLPGRVLYVFPEANIQRNSMPVIVGLVTAHELGSIPECLPERGLSYGVLKAVCSAVQAMPSPAEQLRPNMLATVHFLAPPAAEKADAGPVLRAVVPRRLLVIEGDRASLWLVDQKAGKAVLHPVVLAPGEKDRKTEMVEVVQGLQPTDKLITSGTESLKTGTRVKIVGEEM
jgi:multidrug efflux pump subunit AcrA (membrane-fusion protein)